MSMNLEKIANLQERLQKSKKLPVRVKVVGNATPASKTLSCDLPGVALLIAEGIAGDLPSGVTTVTPADSTGKFSIVLDKALIGDVKKVYKVDVINVTSTQTAAISVSNGYIVIDVDSAADLSAANCEAEFLISYLSK